MRRVYPGLGTIIQVLVVGWTVSFLIDVLDTPDGLRGGWRCSRRRSRCSRWASPPTSAPHTGAGPAEAAALAWDPPVPFKWSYSLVQGGGALIGWLLGATIGVGTIAVIVLLGPGVDLTARLLRLDVHQGPEAEARAPS